MIYVYMAAGESPITLGVDSEDKAFEKGKQYFIDVADGNRSEDLPTGFWILTYTDGFVGVSARFFTARETPRSFSFV